MDNDLDACTLRTVNDEQCPAAESTAAASTVTTEDLDPLPSYGISNRRVVHLVM
jgi:hypothetical protein